MYPLESSEGPRKPSDKDSEKAAMEVLRKSEPQGKQYTEQCLSHLPINIK